MNGLMMDFPLTLAAIFRRAEALSSAREIVTRLPDKTIHRYRYRDFAERTRRLVRALHDLGVQPGDRVATLAWNHYQHLEAYFAVPLAGGVLHTHRSLVLHSFGIALADVIGLCERDAITPVVPMFHANAWGLPYAAVMIGSKLVMPGPHLDPVNLADLMQRERVTITAGVPTLWMGLLQLLDANPGTYDLSSIRLMLVGGSAVPQAMIEAFEKRHGLRIVQGWGMTEMSPVGTLSHVPYAMADAPPDAQYRQRAKQGRPLPFVELRARNEHGIVPCDGKTMGELETRGPWIAASYFKRDDCGDRFTEDGWFKTGDIVTIDERGTVDVQDRSKDLIKSGGEWISSIALENALMGHPAVAGAAVISVPDMTWSERPLAAVVLKAGASATPAELRAFLAPRFPKFWLPDAFEFIDAIPRTSAGKVQKAALRERFRERPASDQRRETAT